MTASRRRRFSLALLGGLGLALLAGGCRGCGPSLTAVGGDFTVSPTSLDFGRALEGTTTHRALTLTSGSRLAMTVDLRVAPPFHAADQVELPAAGEALVDVTFLAGRTEAAAVLHLGAPDAGVDVPLRGVGVQPRSCAPSRPCVVSEYLLEADACVERPAADGATCDPGDLCLEQGRCQGGACSGTARSCDDNDVCTLDGCSSAVGCVHTSRVCPTPSNPCHLATCDPRRGCGEANAPNFSACGPANCTSFSVCFLGGCATLPTPLGQPCGVAVACLPLGTCQDLGSSRACVRPDAGDWQPEWSAQVTGEPSAEAPVLLASGGTVFFEACSPDLNPDAGAPDAGGTLDADGGQDGGDLDGGGPGTWCALVSYSRDGLRRFAAPFADGQPRRLVHVAPRGVLLQGEGGLSYHALSGGVAREGLAMSPPLDGVASAADGVVWLLAPDGGLFTWALDGGATWTLDTTASVLALDAQGRAFLLAPAEATLTRAERLEDGGLGLALLSLDAGWSSLTVAGDRAAVGAAAVASLDDGGVLRSMALDLADGLATPVRGGVLQAQAEAAVFALRCPTPALACAAAEASLWLSTFALDSGVRTLDAPVAAAGSRLVLSALLDLQPPDVAVAAVTVGELDGGPRAVLQVFTQDARPLRCVFPPESTDLLGAVVTDRALVLLARRPDGGIALESYLLGAVPVHRGDWAAPFSEGGARRAR